MPQLPPFPPIDDRTAVVLVCGSRDWTDGAMIHDFLDNATTMAVAYGRNRVVVVDGGGRGADLAARGWEPKPLVATFAAAGETVTVGKAKFKADWKTHGNAAGPIRNAEMLDYIVEARDLGATVEVAAFKDEFGGRGGTEDMVGRCRRAGIPVAVHSHPLGEPASIGWDQGVGNKLRSPRGRREVILNLMWMWGHNCFYCGRRLLHPDDKPTTGAVDTDWAGVELLEPTIDHYFPTSGGGTNVMSNLRLACGRCNKLKADHRPGHHTAVPWAPPPNTGAACPMCDGTGFMPDQSRSCSWCVGRGMLDAETAVAHLGETLRQYRNVKWRRKGTVAELDRLRDMIGDMFHSRHAHHDRARLVGMLKSRDKTIAAMRAELDKRRSDSVADNRSRP